MAANCVPSGQKFLDGSVPCATGREVTIGRVRECPVMHATFVALGHNTIRGAAGAAILNAELMHAEGLLVS